MDNGMKEAVSHFKGLGIPIKNGLIDTSTLTTEQVEILQKWENDTQEQGIMMPNIEDFYRSLLVAISVYPQKSDNQNINYLFGKGFGVEVALRGNVLGRKKNDTNPLYRSHSDFEIYDSKISPTKLFWDIFGPQEYFPPNRTKGLNNIEEGYMDKSYETVVIDGYEVLIPQLELLFADKFLNKESTPREGINDCELLANEYDLNFDLVKELIEKYSIKDKEMRLIEAKNRYKAAFEKKIKFNINTEIRATGDIQTAILKINEFQKFIELYRKGSSAFGIRVDMYVPITDKDLIISENNVIGFTEDYIERTNELIDKITQDYIEEAKTRPIKELDELIERVKDNKKKSNLEKAEDKKYEDIE